MINFVAKSTPRFDNTILFNGIELNVSDSVAEDILAILQAAIDSKTAVLVENGKPAENTAPQASSKPANTEAPTAPKPSTKASNLPAWFVNLGMPSVIKASYIDKVYAEWEANGWKRPADLESKDFALTYKVNAKTGTVIVNNGEYIPSKAVRQAISAVMKSAGFKWDRKSTAWKLSK